MVHNIVSCQWLQYVRASMLSTYNHSYIQSDIFPIAENYTVE